MCSLNTEIYYPSYLVLSTPSIFFGRYDTTAAMVGLQPCVPLGLASRVREVCGIYLVVCADGVASACTLPTSMHFTPL